jgi:hypothetical protein
MSKTKTFSSCSNMVVMMADGKIGNVYLRYYCYREQVTCHHRRPIEWWQSELRLNLPEASPVGQSDSLHTTGWREDARNHDRFW